MIEHKLSAHSNKAIVVVQLPSPVWISVTPQTVDCQAPPSVGFSRQEYWSGLPFPSPGESSWPRDQTCDSCHICIDRWILYPWATREAPATWLYTFKFLMGIAISSYKKVSPVVTPREWCISMASLSKLLQTTLHLFPKRMVEFNC